MKKCPYKLDKIFHYEFTEEQIKKFEEFVSKIPYEDFGAIGGGFSITFTPTGLGEIVKVTVYNKYEIDLTDSDNW